jgi:hypothetical protein
VRVGVRPGWRWPALGRLTATAVVAYFLTALGFHVRAKDPVRNYLPAVGMLAWAAGVLGGFRQYTRA